MAPPPTLQELIDQVRQDAHSEQPLDQLIAAAAAAAQLEETTDALLGHFVDRCRRDGRSWSQISAALGVTKQAVHKRFASAIAAHMVAGSPTWTFERFTDRARTVVAAAQHVALDLGDKEVTTLHLLLGLFSEPEGIAGRVLAAMNVTEASVRAAAPARGPAASPGESGDQPTKATQAFSAGARRALGDALAVALEMGHNYIGTEHILLGLYRNEDSTAARVLTTGGAFEAAARARVSEMLRQLGQK